MASTSPVAVAALLKGLRHVFREHSKAAGHRAQHPPLVAAEALLWIASGVDHPAELAQVMGTDRSTVSRTVSLLRGRARFRNGKAVESPYGLVDLRKHPHRRGYQLALSDNGKELIASTFEPMQQHQRTSAAQVSCESL
jgi:DNA-binding MarR family transcriptional regulator